MAHSPLWATTLGDHRFDDRINDNSLAAIQEERQARRRFLEAARVIPPVELDEQDRTTLGLLTEYFEWMIGLEICAFEEWNVSAGENPVNVWGTLPERHQVKDAASARAYLARVRQIPRWVDNHVENLRRGLTRGAVANAETIRRVLEMTRGQLASPPAEWSLASPARAEIPGMTAPEREAFSRELVTAVAEGVRPSFERYAAVLERELLPAGRDQAHSGVSALPDGAVCYAASIASETGLNRTAAEIHALGEREIARINGEMRALGRKLFGTDELPRILQRLRSDWTLYFSTPEEVEEKARRSLAAAKAAIPRWFGRLPRADCVVRRIPEYEAPYSTIAYYRRPHYDGSKPGEYFVNVSEPATRPRYEAEALAFHESIPGHHLQIAIAQELPAMPMARKLFGSTAFVEGWALYTEQLADEMGLYSGDLDRMGKLSYEAWRASRLVVDTGLHALGWSRSQAERYMLEHTALAENNIRNEVDRYISRPAQALAYKLGQLEILRLRQEAKKALGDRFEIQAFHDAVLGAGGVTLPVLERRVQEWTRSAKPR